MEEEIVKIIRKRREEAGIKYPIMFNLLKEKSVDNYILKFITNRNSCLVKYERKYLGQLKKLLNHNLSIIYEDTIAYAA